MDSLYICGHVVNKNNRTRSNNALRDSFKNVCHKHRYTEPVKVLHSYTQLKKGANLHSVIWGGRERRGWQKYSKLERPKQHQRQVSLSWVFKEWIWEGEIWPLCSLPQQFLVGGKTITPWFVPLVKYNKVSHTVSGWDYSQLPLPLTVLSNKQPKPNIHLNYCKFDSLQVHSFSFNM